MTAIDSVLGRPGDPVKCRTIGETSVHWWNTPTSVGDWCLCGEMQKRTDNQHHQGNGEHCTCWLNDEKPCCACGYADDEALDCTGVMQEAP
jgi:hypothetical protein